MGDKSPPAGSIDKLIEAVNHPRARRVVRYVSIRGGASNRASAALLPARVFCQRTTVPISNYV